MILANRAANIEESLTLAITAKAKKMQADGIDVVGFGAGEPDFNTPQYIVDAAIVALNKGMTKYTPSSGTLSLRKAVCEKFKRDNNLEYKPSQIIVSNGAKHSLYNSMLALIDSGDEVIIPAPYWLTYPELVKLCDGVPVYIETGAKTDFKMTPAQLSAAITKKTKAIILNSPSNPTGSVYTREELFALADVIVKAGIYCISDEIYEKLVYDGAAHTSIAEHSVEMKALTVVVNGVSKTYAMTGWRIGYLACEEKIAKAIDNIQSHITSNANSIAQYASEIALQGGGDFLKTMHGTFDDRRRAACARLDKIKMLGYVVPKGAFYIMVDVSKCFGKSIGGVKIDSAQVFAEKLIESNGVAVVPGEAFGAPNYVRLSYAISKEDIMKGLDRIDAFTQLLK